MQSRTNEILGHRYRLLDRLGEGGMGVVYTATDRLTGHLVALKRVHLRRAGRRGDAGATATQAAGATSSALPTGLAMTEVAAVAPSRQAFAATVAQVHAEAMTPVSFGQQVSDRDHLAFGLALAREFHTLASLRHPHIISVLDYGFDRDGQPFYTMELLEGAKPLLRAIADETVSVRLTLLAQILQALDYLHRRGVLHRDLKPSNILVVQVRGELRVKLLDFGLAVERSVDDDARSELAGTLGYIAPEVLLGQPASSAADLYAVGILAYELLAERHPFADLADHDLIAAACHGEIPPLPASAPPALAALITQLLHPVPDQRPASAAQALSALAQIPEILLPPESGMLRESYLQAGRFVGRLKELACLRDALEAARGGHGATFLIAGESGVGKSRLMDELRTLALVRGLRVLRGQAEATGGAVRQHFMEILRASILDTEIQDDEAAVLKMMLPEVPVLLAREIADPPMLSPQAMQHRSLRVLIDVMLRSDQPTLMLLEDIHFTPSENLGILRGLAQQATTRPMLIVASYRDDERPELPRSVPAAQVLKLNRFSQEAIAELSGAMLGEAGHAPHVVAFLRQETEGNPFFMVEVVRALAEEAGGLAEVGRRPLPRELVANGLQAVLSRRLERVPESERALLRQAAVMGRKLDRAALQTIEPELEGWLQRCTAAAILESSEADYQFAHDKLRERLLASLTDEQRRPLHLRAANALEQVYGRDGEHAAIMGHHFEQAAAWPQAARYLAMAGRQALQRGALQPAAELLQRAITAQQHAGVSKLERAATLRRLAKTLQGTAQNEASMQAMKAGLALLGWPIPDTRGGRLRVFSTELWVELQHRLFGPKVRRTPEDLAASKELHGLMRSVGDALYLVRDQPELPLYLILVCLHAAERVDDRAQQASGLAGLAHITSFLPLPGLSRYYLERANALARETIDPRNDFGFHSLACLLAHAQGAWGEADGHIAQLIKNAESTADLGLLAMAENMRCALACVRDRYDELGQLAQRTEQLGRQLGNAQILASAIAWGALAQQLRGDAEGALPRMERALEKLEEKGSSSHKATIQAALAWCAYQAGKQALARASCDAALTRLSRGVAPAPSFLVAYSSVMLTSLALFEHAHEPSEKAAAQQRVLRALRETARFALAFPLARPWLFLGLGRYLAILGLSLPAQGLLQHSAHLAKRLDMPRVQAQAQKWLPPQSARS